MYLPDLEDLQRLMLSNGVKATELAKSSGVNKGTISRILRKKVEPSYTTMKSLFEAVYSISSAKEKVVAEVMTRRVVTAKEDETIYSVKKKMLRRQAFSATRLIERQRHWHGHREQSLG